MFLKNPARIEAFFTVYSLALGWLGFFGHEDYCKWTDCCTFSLWKEQIRYEDQDETIPPHSRRV